MLVGLAGSVLDLVLCLTRGLVLGSRNGLVPKEKLAREELVLGQDRLLSSD